MSETNLSSFILSVTDLLCGDYKQSEYGKVILPSTVLSRLDDVLEATKDTVLKERAVREKLGLNRSSCGNVATLGPIQRGKKATLFMESIVIGPEGSSSNRQLYLQLIGRDCFGEKYRHESTLKCRFQFQKRFFVVPKADARNENSDQKSKREDFQSIRWLAKGV